MTSRRALWALLAAGILLPASALSVYGLRQLEANAQVASEGRRRDREDSLRRHLRSVARSLDRRLEGNLERYLASIPTLLEGATLGRRGELYAEPWIVHPFRLDAAGALAYPAPPPLPPEEDDTLTRTWMQFLDEAQAREAASPDDPHAAQTYREYVDRGPTSPVIRRAAGLLGARQERREDWRGASEAYEKGWRARRAPLDETSALLGLQRVICLHRVGLAGSATRAACDWLSAFLEGDGIAPPERAEPLLQTLRRHRVEGGITPALLEEQTGLWAEVDRIHARRRLRQALSDWALRDLRTLPTDGGRLAYAYQITRGEAQAIAYAPDGAGGVVGVLLDLPVLQEAFARDIAGDPALAGWSLEPAWAAGPPVFHEAFPARLPIWRLGCDAPRDPGEAGASRRTLLGNLLVFSSLGATVLSFAFLVGALRREWALQHLKSQFVSLVSHELRTPLSLIRTAGETLQMQRLQDPARVASYLTLIVRESENLSRLVNNLLDFSRMDAGRKPYRPETVETSAFLASLARDLREAYGDGEIRWEVDLPEGLPPIRIDPESLRMTLVNLVENAVKFSPEEKTVILRANASDGTVRIEVEDRGIGIPPAERRRIFERFYRCSNAEACRIRGSGIGLALAHHAVTSQGGEVSAHDASPRGTRMRVSFPAAPAGNGEGV